MRFVKEVDGASPILLTALTTGDMITVIRPGGTRETHLLDTLTIPLAAADQMTSETRVVDWGGV